MSDNKQNDPWLPDGQFGGIDLSAHPTLRELPAEADSDFTDHRFGQVLATESQGLRGALVKMVNSNEKDPELSVTLKDIQPESETCTVAGHPARVSWESGEYVVTVDVVWDDNTEESLEWRGDDRSAVLLDAASYLKTQMSPKAVEPSPAALLRVRRLAGSGQIGQALEEYLVASFPGVSKASAENLWNDPAMAWVFDNAVYTCWAASATNFDNDQNFRPWLNAYKGQRPLTVTLCQVAYEQYLKELSMGRVQDMLPKDPTASDLDNLSDAEIESLKSASLREYHRQARGR